MKRRCIASLIMLCSLAAVVSAQGNYVPDWVTREQDVWVEEGIIYARGSAKIAVMSMALTSAINRAWQNISNALANKKITGYAPLPADTESPTTFNVNGVSGTFGDTTTIGMYTAEDGTVFTLVSCTGAEVER